MIKNINAWRLELDAEPVQPRDLWILKIYKNLAQKRNNGQRVRPWLNYLAKLGFDLNCIPSFTEKTLKAISMWTGQNGNGCHGSIPGSKFWAKRGLKKVQQL